MKKFSNLDKIQDAVASFLENLEDINKSEKSNTIRAVTDYYMSDNDGLLSIVGGKLSLKPPKEDGNWPIIKACENIKIMLRGEEIKGPIVVKDVNDIEIEAKDRPAESKFHLHLSPDKTRVILETEFIQGQSFDIRDVKDQHELMVEAIPCNIIHPSYINEELIYEELKQMGVSLEVDKSAVVLACQSLTNSQTVIVRGKEMVPPVDGRVKYMFSNNDRIYKEEGEDREIDFFYKGDINSIEKGKMLAITIPPIPGEPGLTVMGDLIPAPEGRPAKINVGQGARLTNSGNAAVATISGRPGIRGNRTVYVMPELVIKGDVNIETGHINFKGDVRILGNVTEGLVVRATGRVYIEGSVFHAKIYAGNGIHINNIVVGGLISAGGEAANYRSMLPLLEELKNDLQGVEDAFNQLKNNEKFSTYDLEVRGHGYFIKLIIEMRFPNILKNLKRLCGMIPKDNDIRRDGIWPAIELMHIKFSGLGPLNIKLIDEITKYKDFLKQIIEYICEDIDEPADIMISYCQNAVVKATGDVAIGSSGVYHSKIYSGGEINIKGFCRGGEICGKARIVTKALGSTMNVPTLAAVSTNGKIVTEEIYPNVILRIGGYNRKIYELKRHVGFVFRGEIIEQFC